jgi:elongation factor Ts
MTDLDLVKKIRNRTNLSYGDIQKAIKKLDSEDEDEIISYLREQGVLKSQARQDRDTNQGGIFSYVHDNKLGVLVEIKCETDFVSRSDVFKDLGLNLALHIAANQPKFVSSDDVDENFIKQELEIARELLINQQKPDNIIDKILEGKKDSIVKEFSLLEQNYLKDPSISVKSLITHISQETGEKILVSRFAIYSLNS